MPVQLSHAGRVAIVVMDRPEARNAMNLEMTDQLEDVYDQLAEDDQTWVVVVTGAGDRAFCAGQDLNEVGLAFQRAQSGESRRPSRGFGGITRREFPKPLIAAVNGFALGGGFEICLACDLVVAEEHASFGLPEVKRGIFAGAGGLVRLGRRLPLALALEMAMTGEPVSAQRALELGLVNRVAPRGHGVRVALELAEVICQAAPLSVRLTKRVMRGSVEQGEEDVFALQARLGAEVRQTEDYREGPRAFLEKRTPRWQAR
jgi:enoyl-CoA hydratase